MWRRFEFFCLHMNVEKHPNEHFINTVSLSLFLYTGTPAIVIKTLCAVKTKLIRRAVDGHVLISKFVYNSNLHN